MAPLKKAEEKYLCGDLETHLLVVMEQLKDVIEDNGENQKKSLENRRI